MRPEDKIDCLIFSKDRPMQLHGLLDSVCKYAPDLFNLSVLSVSTLPKYEMGYNKVQECFRNVEFYEEECFQQDVLDWLRVIDRTSHVCFLVDDILYYRSVSLSAKQIKEIVSDFFACFSLRLGENTTDQTYAGLPPAESLTPCYSIPLFSPLNNPDYIYWDRLKYSPFENYGYPISVDGHIFKRETILNITNMLEGFNGPNQYEGQLALFHQKMPRYIASFQNSVLVNSPNNIVQNEAKNIYGKTYPFSQENLCERYLRGERLDLDAIDFSNIKSCHQELELRFKTCTFTL